MAFNWNNIVVLICLIPAIQGHQVHIKVEPENIAVGLTRRLDITCSLQMSTNTHPNNSDILNIQGNQGKSTVSETGNIPSSHNDVNRAVSVFIYKISDVEKIAAAVSTLQPATATMNVDKSTASGYVNASLNPTAYLRVSWNNPDKDQEGNYSCVIHIIDVLGRSGSLEESVEVVMKDPTLEHLVGHVWDMETRAINQNKQIEQLYSTYKNLTKWNRQLQVQNLVKDSAISSLQNNLQEVNEKMERLKDELSNDINELQTIEANQSNTLIDYAKVRQAQGFGFTAKLLETVDVLRGISPGIIKFNTALTNVGNHYDTTTGIFTAPAAGTYLAFISIQQHLDGYIISSMFHRSAQDLTKTTVCSVRTWANGVSSSCSGVVRLRRLDTLYVEMTQVGGSPTLVDVSTFSCLSLY